MIRYSIILTAIVLVLIIFVRQKLYRSRVEGQGELECGMEADEFGRKFIEKLSPGTEAPELPELIRNGRSAADLAEAAWLSSLAVLAVKHGAVVKRREKALFRAKVLPGFAAIVVAMAMVALKIRPGLGILIWMLLAILIQIPVWTTQVVDREAAKIAIEVIRKRRIFSRIRDEEKVVSCLKGIAWKRLLPFG